MNPRHIALATMVAALWGFNFVVIRAGLDDMPPLLFASLRFVVAALPAVFFVRRPGVPWRWLLIVGVCIGVGQFGLLFTGMHLGMPAGLASLVLQAQALFTIIFAGALLRERLSRLQAVGMVIAFGGLIAVGIDFGQTSPVLAFVLCLVGAASWALGNIGLRKARVPDAFSFMVWMSLIPPVPLFLLSVIFERPGVDVVTGISLKGIGALLYIAYLSTLVGFGLWGWLMRRYDAGVVGMYSLLVPPFGMASAALVLGENISALQICAAAAIIGGVALGSVRRRGTGARANAARVQPVYERLQAQKRSLAEPRGRSWRSACCQCLRGERCVSDSVRPCRARGHRQRTWRTSRPGPRSSATTRCGRSTGC